jgi:hypothetical protein
MMMVGLAKSKFWLTFFLYGWGRIHITLKVTDAIESKLTHQLLITYL